MSYRIRFHDLVADDLFVIRQYWEEELQASPDRILNLIFERIYRLPLFPYICRQLEEYPSLRRMIVEDYVVLYQVDEEREAIKKLKLNTSIMDHGI